MQSDESCIDLGPLVVGATGYRHLTLANNSVCDLQYKLLVEQLVSGPYGDDYVDQPPPDNDEQLGMLHRVMENLQLGLKC